MRAKKNLDKISRTKFRAKDGYFIVIDDESFVPLDSRNIPCHTYYTCRDKKEVSPEQKYKKKSKFCDKFCVWQAIGEDGQVSPAYVAPNTIKAENYRKECLKKRLVPWLKKTYPDKKIYFWPDMSRCHYTDEVIMYLAQQGVEFPLWDENAPKVPQARPIEQLWSLAKQEYARRKIKCKDAKELAVKWRYISRTVSKQHGARLMCNVRQKVRETGRNGVYALFE